uniref:Chalcone isomerase domain-containing protein n=1 Tax=Entomoneis paludosa TaxID=265537 RepID=A0A7S2V6S6_9STRA|mmetsp:Transcript_10093/g.20837  ORF Transcript_10093/g.20837 Transcript_10093/m.20837 type:complete len:198 (+) Transcript_10093:69-662(+)
MRSLFIALSVLFIAYCRASMDVPLTVHGVVLPVLKEIGDGLLTLNGHGLRQFKFYGIQMDMYVAGLYSSDRLLEEEDVWETDGPIIIDFVFLKAVNPGRMRFAWGYQMDMSVSHKNYPTYHDDREKFLSLLGSLDKMGVQSVQMIGSDTVILENGLEKGKIEGRNFQKAFLSMWFGQNPVTAEMKAGLLGSHTPVAA